MSPLLETRLHLALCPWVCHLTSLVSISLLVKWVGWTRCSLGSLLIFQFYESGVLEKKCILLQLGKLQWWSPKKTEDLLFFSICSAFVSMEGKTLQTSAWGRKEKEDTPLRLRGGGRCPAWTAVLQAHGAGVWGGCGRMRGGGMGGGVGVCGVGWGQGVGGIRGCDACAPAVFPGQGDCSKALLHPSPAPPSRDLWAASGQMCPVHAMASGLSQCWRAACFLHVCLETSFSPHDYQSNTHHFRRVGRYRKVLRSMRTNQL